MWVSDRGTFVAVIKIERFGGLAGFGVPGSHVASRGQIHASDLSAPDQKAVEALFERYGKGKKKSRESLARDDFRYRISRTVDGGEQTIEVVELEVPAALVQCVRDELI